MSLHPAVLERLSKLAADQRAAATAPPGPVLCVAPAGSGKTTTLVARICWLVAGGADPATVTAVTFNKRAAEELELRLTTALEPLAIGDRKPRVRTFHALGREILAEAGISVANLLDRAEVLRRVRGRPLASAELRRLDDAFSRIKLDLGLDADALRQRGGMVPARTAIEPDIAAAFVAYEDALARADALDFDDLVRRALQLLRRDRAVLEMWQQRCRNLLVDEVQDVDRSQLELAVMLAGAARNVFLVGDDDQTIYAWRLADVRRVLDLAASLPGLRRVDLVTNYRCPRPVVDRAVKLIAGNRERFAKTIQARPNAEGQLFLVPDAGDDVARARRLLREWAGHAEGVHAVLARTNAELAPYAAVALEMGLPYRAVDDGLLLDDPRLDVLLGTDKDETADLPAVSLARRAGRDPLARALLSWATPYRTWAELRAAVGVARERRADAAPRRRGAGPGHGPRHQRPGVRSRRVHWPRRRRVPKPAHARRGGRSVPRARGGAPARLRRVDACAQVAGARI